MLCIFFTLCCLAYGQIRNQFTCSFTMSQPNLYKFGVATGTLKYDWTAHNHEYAFNAGSSREVYNFNTQAGYANQDGQYKFTTSSKCSCTFSPLEIAQPPLTQDLGYLTLISGNTYKPSKTGSTLTNVTLSNGYPTVAYMSSPKRVFTFTGCAAATFTATSWDPPAGCSCDKPVDVIIALDRSETITSTLFPDEKKFVNDFVNQLTFGPTKVNLGITNFNTLTWDGPVELKDGVSMTAVTTGANALACSPSTQCHVSGSAGSCCGSGSCISCGIVNSANMLDVQASTASNRRLAAKVLIVFTNGMQNKLCKKQGELPVYDNNVKPYGESAAGTIPVASLLADIAWGVEYATRKVPGLTIYAVGASSLADSAQLLAIAGSPDRVITSSNWAKLPSVVTQLVAKACTGALPSTVKTCCAPEACSSWCEEIVAVNATVCNDMNTLGGDGCSETCIVEPGWTCTPTCKPICGDGKKIGAEACDDGNTVSGDGCSSTCTVEDGWFCPTVGKPCLEIYGDCKKVGKEQCDDGNQISGDGCSATGIIELGWSCPTLCKPCEAICGDGRKVGKEICDDGNKVSGDGCSSTCTVEAGFTCPTAGEKCKDLDECSLYRCLPDTYNSNTCQDSTTVGHTVINYNYRKCICFAPGLVVNGTVQSLGVYSQLLQGNAKFAGCVDVNECTLYGCPSINGGSTCEESGATSTTVALSYRRCTCTATGWYSQQSQVGSNTVLLYHDAAFEGCITRCGDAIMVGGETCDDGNFVDGDGCNTSCQVEAGWVCSQPGQACCQALPSAVNVGNPSCVDGWWVYGTPTPLGGK